MRSILVACAVLTCIVSFAQEELPVPGIPAPPGFKAKDDVVAVYDSFFHVYRLSFSVGEMIFRKTYDTSFNLLEEYEFPTLDLSFSSTPTEGKLGVALPLITPAGYYEVYTSDRRLEIYRLNYVSKRDTLVAQLDFDHRESSGECITSLIPRETGLTVLMYSKKKNELRTYNWTTNGSITGAIFKLPEKSLTTAEQKIHDDVTVIKLKSLWKETYAPQRVNTVKTFLGENQLYYTEDHIYLVIPIPYGMGIYLVTLDTRNNTLTSRNYFINDLRVNVGEDHSIRMKPVGMVFDRSLVILNSSRRRFEYLIFPLDGPNLLKKLSVPVEDSFFNLVHSQLVRKGSVFSKEDEKEFKKEKHFMRVTGGDFSFLNLTSLDKDSVMFTFVYLKRVTTVQGRILTGALSRVLPPIPYPFGNLRFAPYLWSYNYNLMYGHSKFDRQSFAPSRARDLRAPIDKIVDKFAVSELESSSTFYVERNGNCLLGVLDKEKSIYNIYRFSKNNY